MDTFLQDGHNLARKSSAECQTIHIVMGNESCDLDSAISAITYAYFLHLTNPTEFGSIIPILNIPRAHLPLKTEVLHVLRKYSLNTDHIICRDELNIERLIGARLILVDHHILNDKFAKNVVKILDHRPIDTKSWIYDDKVSSRIETAGSCATLVASEINRLNADAWKQDNRLARLIYDTIVLDTVNFLPEAGKVQPIDLEMADVLEKIIGVEDVKNYRKQTFDELLKARTDYSNLNSDQLLLRDLKIVNNIPIPVFPMLVKEYLAMDNAADALKSFCKSNNYEIVLLIGIKILDKTALRDLAVYSSNALGKALTAKLIESTDPNLSLVKVDLNIENIEYFEQSNIKASRKQILPLVKELQ